MKSPIDSPDLRRTRFRPSRQPRTGHRTPSALARLLPAWIAVAVFGGAACHVAFAQGPNVPLTHPYERECSTSGGSRIPRGGYLTRYVHSGEGGCDESCSSCGHESSDSYGGTASTSLHTGDGNEDGVEICTETDESNGGGDGISGGGGSSPVNPRIDLGPSAALDGVKAASPKSWLTHRAGSLGYGSSYTSATLFANQGHGGEVLRVSGSTGSIRQFITDRFIADVNHIDSGAPEKGFTVKIYIYDTVPGKSGGFYNLGASGVQKIRTITFSNPDHASGVHTRLKILQEEEAITGGFKRQWIYEKTVPVAGEELWTLTAEVYDSTWKTIGKEDLRRVPATGGYKQMHRKQTTTWELDLTTTSKVWEQWETFTINGSTRIRIRERHAYSTDTWSTALPSPASAPSGAIAKITWDYHRNGASPFSYGRASQRREYGFISTTPELTHSEDYSYADYGSNTARTTDRSGPGYTERFIYEESAPPTTFPRERWPAVNSTTYRQFIVGGTTTVARTDVSATVSGSDMKITTTGYQASGGNIVTEEYYHGSSAAAAARWKRKATKHPDGTWTLFTHAAGEVVETTGVGSSSAITYGTAVERHFNRQGYQTLETATDVYSEIVTAHWEVDSADDFGRPLVIEYNGDAADYVELAYDCCGLGSRRERDGFTTSYTYDYTGRVLSSQTNHSTPVTDNFLTTRFSFGGYLTTEHNSGALLVSKRMVDMAGRTISTSAPDTSGDSAAETTSHTYAVESGGALKETVTAPAGTYFIYRHGSGETFLMNGPGVRDTRFEYSAAGSYKTAAKRIDLTYDPGTSTEIEDHWTKTVTDSAGRTVSVEYSHGPSTTYTDDYVYFPSSADPVQAHRLKSMTDRDGIVRLYDYDYTAEGELHREAVDLDVDGNGAIDLGSDNVTETLRDVVDDTAATIGLGDSHRTRTYVYKPGSSTPVLVNTTWIAVDGFKRRSDSFGRHTRWEYALGNFTGGRTETTSSANGTSIDTHANWRLASRERMAYGDSTIVHTTGFAYNSIGRVSSTTDSRTGLTSYTYFDSGALKTQTLERGAGSGDDIVTTIYRDTAGRVTHVDGPGGSAYTSYSADGEIQKKWGHGEYPVSFAYDEQGRMTDMRTFRDITDNSEPPTTGGDLTLWAYNSYTGLLTTKTDEEDKSTTYTYTRGGRVLTRAWARDSGGVTTTYSYALGSSLPGDDSGVSTISGKLTKVAYSGITPATPGVTFAYDRLGRPTAITDATGSRSFAYEDGGDLGIDTETLDGLLDKTLEWSRDAQGRRSGFAATGLSTLTYTYDTLGRLDTIHQGVPGDPIADYAYVSQSPHLVASVALNDGAYSVTNTWETHRDILDTKVNKAGATTVSSYDYTVNTQGQRTGVAMSGSAFSGTPSWGWSYNDTGEVTAADHSASTPYNRAYEYDGLGNRKKSSSGANDPVGAPWGTGATVRAYTRNNLNQYTALTNPSASPVHDVDGNLTDDGTKLYSWDAENRLAQVKRKSDSAVIATYTYDYLGRRVRKVTTNNALQLASDILYLYDGWNLVAEYTNGGTPALARSYVWGLDLSGSLQGAGGVGGLLRVTDHAGPTHYFPTYDGNGNVSEYLTGASTVSTHFEYDAFGNVVNTPASPTSANFRFQFSTKQVDRETGFSYYGLRYYDAVTGRWLSRDPLEENFATEEFNMYGFVTNNSNTFIDFLGLNRQGNPPSYTIGLPKDQAFKLINEREKTPQAIKDAKKRWEKKYMERKSSIKKNKGKKKKKPKPPGGGGAAGGFGLALLSNLWAMPIEDAAAEISSKAEDVGDEIEERVEELEKAIKDFVDPSKTAPAAPDFPNSVDCIYSCKYQRRGTYMGREACLYGDCVLIKEESHSGCLELLPGPFEGWPSSDGCCLETERFKH